MPLKKARTNTNHPKKGSAIKVEPIRSLDDIKRIKMMLYPNLRDVCLFTLGVNTAYRASELLSLSIAQVRHLKVGDTIDLRQAKTRHYRMTTLNAVAVEAIQAWLEYHPRRRDEAPLFVSSRTGDALTVPAVSRMVKVWCREIGLHGNYASHTMRKTWGYHRLRKQSHIPKELVLPSLMVAYGHSTQQQTLEYLCIQSEEIAQLYLDMEL